MNLGESLMKLTLCRWPLTPIDNPTPDRPKPRTTTDESNAGSNAQRSMRLVMHQAARTEAGSRFLEGLEGVRSSTLKQAQVFSVRLTRLYIMSRFQNYTVTGKEGEWVICLGVPFGNDLDTAKWSPLPLSPPPPPLPP